MQKFLVLEAMIGIVLAGVRVGLLGYSVSWSRCQWHQVCALCKFSELYPFISTFSWICTVFHRNLSKGKRAEKKCWDSWPSHSSCRRWSCRCPRTWASYARTSRPGQLELTWTPCWFNQGCLSKLGYIHIMEHYLTLTSHEIYFLEMTKQGSEDARRLSCKGMFAHAQILEGHNGLWWQSGQWPLCVPTSSLSTPIWGPVGSGADDGLSDVSQWMNDL